MKGEGKAGLSTVRVSERAVRLQQQTFLNCTQWLSLCFDYSYVCEAA